MYLKERIEEVVKKTLETYIKEKVITVSDEDKDEAQKFLATRLATDKA